MVSHVNLVKFKDTFSPASIRAFLPVLGRTAFIWVVTAYNTIVYTYFLFRWAFGDITWRMGVVSTLVFIPLIPFPFLLLGTIWLRARKTFYFMLPIAAILLIWIIPHYLPKAAVIPTGKTIEALTLNVWGNNHDLNKIEGWIRQNQPDIITLQEISPAYANNSLPNLRDLYPYQSSQPDNTRWGGNITLSRFPILTSEYVDLNVPEEANPERLVLDVDGHRLVVYNVHLAWPSGNMSRTNDHLSAPSDNFYVQTLFNFDDTIRNQQIAGLLAHVRQETDPVIVAGDFNTSDFSSTYDQIAGQLHDSFREMGWGLGGSWPVAQARGLPAFLPPAIRIDYIWHNNGLRTVNAWQGPPVGSDHLPLFATLELTEDRFD